MTFCRIHQAIQKFLKTPNLQPNLESALSFSCGFHKAKGISWHSVPCCNSFLFFTWICINQPSLSGTSHMRTKDRSSWTYKKIPQIITQYAQACEAPPHTVGVEWDTLYYLKFSINSAVPSAIKNKIGINSYTSFTYCKDTLEKDKNP